MKKGSNNAIFYNSTTNSNNATTISVEDDTININISNNNEHDTIYDNRPINSLNSSYDTITLPSLQTTTSYNNLQQSPQQLHKQESIPPPPPPPPLSSSSSFYSRLSSPQLSISNTPQLSPYSLSPSASDNSLPPSLSQSHTTTASIIVHSPSAVNTSYYHESNTPTTTTTSTTTTLFRELYTYITTSVIYTFFFKIQLMDTQFKRFVHPFTLHFKEDELENSYTNYLQHSGLKIVIVQGIVAAAVLLIYIVIDSSYPMYWPWLVANRIFAAGSIIFIGVITWFFFRKHLAYFCSLMIFVASAAVYYSLVLRGDTNYSGLVPTTLWLCINFAISKIMQRVVVGALLILAHFITWIFMVEITVGFLFTSQTLNYLLFFIGVVLAGLSRETLNRRVYLQIKVLRNQSFAVEKSTTFTQFHTSVVKCVMANANRFTLTFHDKTKEKHFRKWWIDDTEGLVRRFFVVNIAATTVLVMNDLEYASSDLSNYLMLRFAVLVPLLILGLVFGSVVAKTKRFRLEITAILTFVYGAITIYCATALALADPANGVEVFDLYYSAGVRAIIFGFSGTGMRTVHSVLTGVLMMVMFLIVGFIIAVSPSIVICLVVVIGIPLVYTEERTSRINFLLLFYHNDVIEFINTKP